jgi:hypothetical protein
MVEAREGAHRRPLELAVGLVKAVGPLQVGDEWRSSETRTPGWGAGLEKESGWEPEDASALARVYRKEGVMAVVEGAGEARTDQQTGLMAVEEGQGSH